MGYKANGVDLSAGLILRPGSRFKRTRAGFDAGARTYTCDRAVTALLAPQVGDSDLILPGGLHARMFVDDVDIDEGRNQIDTLSISFLGLFGGGSGSKPAIISGGSSSNQFIIGGRVTATDVTPSVSVAYVQDTLPDPWAVGQGALPPIAVSPTDAYGARYILAIDGYLPPIFEGWVLARRDFRQAGPLWEITDTYEYKIVRSSGAA